MTVEVNGPRDDVGTAANRAATGAKWLDDIKPNWFKVVKTSTLDLGSGVDCILAQVSKKPYTTALLEWLPEQGGPVDEVDILDFALSSGFRLNGTDDRDDLTRAWAAEIAARKERKSVAAVQD